MAITNTHLTNIKETGGGNAKKKREDEITPAYPAYGTQGTANTPNYADYYSAVSMPNWQTYTPAAFSGWQTYQDNPYGGYQDFTYDPFQYEDFSYDYRTDPLYQMYEEQYTQKGQQAMQDALTALSARTGGVANSYSQAAAQNEYNTYMANLAAKIPELQQIARDMYETDRGFAYNQYQDDRNMAYNNYLRGYNEDYANWQNANAINQANVDLANQYNYANWQMQEAARQAAVNWANDAAMQQWKYQQDAANSNAALKYAAAQAAQQQAAAQNTTPGSNSGSSGSSGGSNWKPDAKQIRYDLIDNAVKYGKDETTLDAMANEYINSGYIKKSEYEKIKKEIMNLPLDSLQAEQSIRGSVRAAR